ncbi:MAG: hypothetical protein A4E30_00090 [Methanomassiliicoccales archaeon PtaB.Bin215]|nr:MAG: hypothetical protein A4E30_00090 [Methanomassiliicoccales archaeon PtaB.Bin215]
MAFFMRSSLTSPRWGSRERSMIDSTFFTRYSLAWPVANFFSRYVKA